MDIIKTASTNPNYLAEIVKIATIERHPNADRLQITKINFNTIITGMDAKVGDLYVYFPLECAINKEYLSWSNSFAKAELNADTSIKSYFDNNGRVRACSLRKVKSEGYIVPISSIEEWLKTKGIEISLADYVNQSFDTIGDILLCEKYMVPIKMGSCPNPDKKKVKKESRLVEDQFRLSPDYKHLKKEIHTVSPDDWIEISAKFHGANCAISNLLTKKRLSWKDKIAKYFGIPVIDTQYGLVYSSRSVIKNANFEEDIKIIPPEKRWETLHLFQKKTFFKQVLGDGDAYRQLCPEDNEDATIYTYDYCTEKVQGLKECFEQYCKNNQNQNHFYGHDVWGIVAKKYQESLQPGITCYGELVGYTPSGSGIQNMGGKTYDYGCKKGECDFFVFRITYTSPTGNVYEFSAQQMLDYCNKYSLKHVPFYYIGKAKDKYPELSVDHHWHENFLEKMMEEYLEKDDIYCNTKGLFDEGVVLSKRVGGFTGLKLKSFRFVSGETMEMDNGNENIEDTQIPDGEDMMTLIL